MQANIYYHIDCKRVHFNYLLRKSKSKFKYSSIRNFMSDYERMGTHIGKDGW